MVTSRKSTAMKIHFIQKLVGQPWDISRERGRAIMAAMIQRLRDHHPDDSPPPAKP